MAGMLAAAGSMIQTAGFPSRMPLNWKLISHGNQSVALKTPNGDLLNLGKTSTDEKFAFIVWGDSHANVAAPAFDTVAERLGIHGINAAKGGRPPIPGTSISWEKKLSEWNSDVLKFIKANRIPHVFLIARWSQFIEGPTKYDQLNGRGFTDPLLRCSPTEKPTRESSEVCVQTGLERLIKDLEATGCTIWIVKQVPDQNYDPLRKSFLEHRGLALAGNTISLTRDAFDQRQNRVNTLFTGLISPNVRLIDLSRNMFDSEGIAITSSNGVPFYRDNSHLSGNGRELYIQPIVEEVLSGILKSNMPSPEPPAGDSGNGNAQK
jgi:hypothetical protein